MSWGLRGRTIGAVALVVAVAAACTPRQPWNSELASVNAAGNAAGNHESTGAMLSADGSMLVFQSRASDLAAGDTNGTYDVFVRDLRTGRTSVVSASAGGTGSGNSWSMNPVISADGTKVAFESTATDLTSTVEPNGSSVDVYVRDLASGVTSLVATSTEGVTSPQPSLAPEFSPDGTKLAFVGVGLHPLDPPATIAPEVYVRDLATGQVDLVTVNATGDGSANAWTFVPGDFSADGTMLAFSSTAQLVAEDTNLVGDLFVRDLAAGTTTLVSAEPSGTAGGNDFTGPGASFSPDGSLLAFTSDASDLVPTDTNRSRDVFVRDLVAGTTRLVSVNASGTDSGRGALTHHSSDPVFSPDGGSIAFVSDASDLGPTDGDADADLFGDSDVYLRDLDAATTSMVSSNPAGTDSDRGTSSSPIFTADGRRLLFFSAGFPLGGPLMPTDTGELYLKDLVTGTVTMVSAPGEGIERASFAAHTPSMSADGRTVAFQSVAADRAPNDANRRVDVFVARLEGADLAVTVDPMAATPGTTTTVRARVDNSGPHTAAGAVVLVVLPPALAYVDARGPASPCAPPTEDQPGAVACPLGDLAAGDEVAVEVDARVTGPDGDVLVVASSTVIDPEPANSSVTRPLG